MEASTISPPPFFVFSRSSRSQRRGSRTEFRGPWGAGGVSTGLVEAIGGIFGREKRGFFEARGFLVALFGGMLIDFLEGRDFWSSGWFGQSHSRNKLGLFLSF